jgi:hypothetical protein
MAANDAVDMKQPYFIATNEFAFQLSPLLCMVFTSAK